MFENVSYGVPKAQTNTSYLDEYRIIKTLGSGYHAKVKLAQAPNKTLVAIKRFKKQTADLSTMKHQLGIMKDLHHGNLVNLIDVRDNAIYKKKSGDSYRCIAIILEYVGGGELFDFVAIGGKFSQVVSRTYFYQLMNAVHYMHEKGYAHRDIKPQNILLTVEYVLKLADFGFATLLAGKDKSGILHTKLGTEGYMAPEVQLKNYDGKKADIFSCGVILFIMYTATPPFQRSVPNDPYYKLIKEENYAAFWGYHSKRRPPGFFSDNFKNLIQRMLAYDAQSRPSMFEVSKHAWVKEPVVTIPSLNQEFAVRKAKVHAEMQNQRLQRQKKKDAISQAIYSPFKVTRDSDLQVFEFKEAYQKEYGTVRDLKIKPEIFPSDYVVKEGEDFVFPTVSIYLSKKVTFDDQLVLCPEFKLKGDKFDIKYTYQYTQEQKQSVEMSLTISKNSSLQIVLSFQRLGGNFLYYKRLVHLLQNEFSYCRVKP